MCSFRIICFPLSGNKQLFSRGGLILIATLQNCHNINGLDCNQELIKLSQNKNDHIPAGLWETSQGHIC